MLLRHVAKLSLSQSVHVLYMDGHVFELQLHWCVEAHNPDAVIQCFCVSLNNVSVFTVLSSETMLPHMCRAGVTV